MDEEVRKKVERFFLAHKHQEYKKGELLIRADDDPRGIFYLRSGNVKQYAISRNGEELVINIFKPVAFFPMSWAINQTPNVYFYEAMTAVEVYRVTREEVIAFIKANPDVLYDLISRVYRGVDGLLTRMTYLMSGGAYARLLTELLIYARRFAKGENSVEITISEKDLAAQTGMTRETVSREIKQLKDKGIITLKRAKITITDVQRLEDDLAESV